MGLGLSIADNYEAFENFEPKKFEVNPFHLLRCSENSLSLLIVRESDSHQVEKQWIVLNRIPAMSEEGPSKKRRTIEDVNDLTGQAEFEILPSDTEMVIDSIQRAAEKQFGFVFQHQIYATLAYRSIVDEELNSLRHVAKSYKFLQCDFTKASSGSVFPNATLLIKTQSYVNSISHFLSANKSLEFTDTTDHLLCVKFSHWLETTSQMSMFRHELKNAELFIPSDSILSTKKQNVYTLDESSNEDGKVARLTLTEAEIDRLIQVGFLHYRNTDAGSQAASSSTRNQELYWLSHPAVR